jgi:hypothetical protein
MVGEGWLDVPIGPDASAWVTARTLRTVLVAVHTAAGLGHLLDAIELLECDTRIQVAYTQAPDVLSNGLAKLVHGLGGIVLPWQQAIRSEFDLALAADCAGTHQLRAPVLLLGHGVMNNKFAPSALGGPASGLVVGLSAPWLTWYGRLVPATVALSHSDLREVLAEQCPQALRVAAVTGDLCLDRLVVSRARRDRYRKALAVGRTTKIVAVSSTWGPDSMFATSRALFDSVLRDLPPAEYTVVAGLHPAVWYGHGRRQVLAWLREPRRRGLRLVEPLGWRGLAAAADLVVGDHGSATVYAAAAGVPVLRLPTVADSVANRSAVGQLAAAAPTLTAGQPLVAQVDLAVRAAQAEAWRSIAARVTSEPGRAATLLRSAMYRLLRLPEPAAPPETAPVPTAQLISD